MSRPEALAFDMYGTLVNPLRIWQQLEQFIPGDTSEVQRIAEVWRQKQLEFTFRLTVMEQYEDFEQVTRKALDYALAMARKHLDTDQKNMLMAQYNDLERFADVEPGLQRLKEAGYTMVVFSNGSPSMLGAIMQAAGRSGHVTPISAADYASQVARPAYSVLDNRAWRILGEAPLPDWREGLSAYVDELRSRGKLTPALP